MLSKPYPKLHTFSLILGALGLVVLAGGCPTDDFTLPGINQDAAADPTQPFAQGADEEMLVLQQKLTGPARSRRFGSSVSVSGDTAIVGVGLGNSAYVFRFNGTTWVEKQSLTAPDDPTNLTGFGYSVAVSGDTAVVIGATMDGCAPGTYVFCRTAHIYRFNGTSWVEEQTLTISDHSSQFFSHSAVSVSGDTVVVGAYQSFGFLDFVTACNCGSAHVFRFNGTSWVEEQKLTASDAASGDFFGQSVSVNGDTVVVGAMWADCAAGAHCGAAYVYRYNGTSWVEEQKLTASDAREFDNFGSSVVVSGDTACVGAPSANCATGLSCGAAYVFHYNGTSWVEEQKLTASDKEPGDAFGTSVSVSGDMAVVGAGADGCALGLGCGATYVYRFNGASWVEEQKLTAPDAEELDLFGSSVSVSGDTTVVGAPGNDCADGGLVCGAAYVYRCAPRNTP